MENIKLLPKWTDSTIEALKECNQEAYKGPITPWNELWKAQDECPKTIYYFDCFTVTSEGQECKIGLIPSMPKRKRKPAKPSKCPHCGLAIAA